MSIFTRLRTASAASLLSVLSAPTAVPTAPPPRAPRTTGRIEGTVIISAALSPRRPQFRIYADPGAGALPPSTPRAADAVAAEIHNVVIYLEGDSTQLPASPDRLAAARHARVVQRGERFVPHVVPALAGATIEFPNEDDLYHNVFSLSNAAGPKGFDLGRYPKGTSRSWTFPRPGTVQVFCHIHSDMSAVLLLLSNPFFTTPDDARHFVLEDVPEGDYTIVGWHERIRPVSRRVHVAAGQTATVDFNIPLPPVEAPR
jgi:plastocyanin